MVRQKWRGVGEDGGGEVEKEVALHTRAVCEGWLRTVKGEHKQRWMKEFEEE